MINKLKNIFRNIKYKLGMCSSKNLKLALIILAIVVFMTVSVLFICKVFYNKNKPNPGEEGYYSIDYEYINGILNTYDIKDSKIGLKSSSAKVADKYELGKSNIQESKKNIPFGDIEVKAIYVRSEKLNLNVLQGIYEISSDGELQQVSEYMNKFKENLYSITNIDYNQEPTEEKLYGESKYWFKIPVEESVYVEKRLYSLRYEVDIANNMYDDIVDNDKYTVNTKSTYDLNFYMSGNLLVCELVRVL